MNGKNTTQNQIRALRSTIVRTRNTAQEARKRIQNQRKKETEARNSKGTRGPFQRRNTISRGRSNSSQGRRRNTRNGNVNHRAVVSFVNRIKSLGNGDVPILKTWGGNADLDIPLGMWESGAHDATVVRGVEFLSKIMASTTLAPQARPTDTGDVLFVQPATPMMLDGTRIQQMCRLFQTMDILHIAFHIKPIVPATQNGALISGITYDPEQDLTAYGGGDTRVRQLLAMEGFHITQVFETTTVSWTHNVMQGLWTAVQDSDPRLMIPGNFVVAAGSSFSPFDGQSFDIDVCNVFVSYEIRFHNRGLLDTILVEPQGYVQYEQSALSAIIEYSVNNTFIHTGQLLALNAAVPGIPPNLKNHTYVFECRVIGSDLSAHPDFMSTDPYVFETEGKDGFALTRGTPFWMVYAPNPFYQDGMPPDQDSCFLLSSTLSSALRSAGNIFWKDQIQLNSLSWFNFVWRPISIT